MEVQEQIRNYINDQPQPKRTDVEVLHALMLQILPGGKLWYEDGKNSENQTVTNPQIGYGLYTIKYANGKAKPYFQIGLSAKKTGISVYILGIADKAYLAKTYADKLGKASITGYCIKFKKLQDVNIDVLEAAIRDGIEATSENEA